MQIVDNAALQMTVPAIVGAQIVQSIEKSHTVRAHAEQHEVLVNWDYEEAADTAAMLDAHAPDPNIPDVPSPIMRDYAWPGVYKPFDHQKVTASFLSLRPRAF